MRLKRTHSCGTLGPAQIGETVTLNGWVHRYRDHGGLVFLDLRDRSGIVQLVVDPSVAPEAHALASRWRREYVVAVRGEVRRRPPGTENPKLATGEIEVLVREAELLNASDPLPLSLDEEPEDDQVRLRYRYLDLRRPRLQRNLELRHRVILYIRRFLDARGFWEVETPILTKSTPEGARDYLVPSRIHPGKFYALPQSPQQLKQLLMVAGVERYFQIARCFRDEDLRADRQPEFTQLDLEMSFVEQDDVLQLTEELFIGLTTEVGGKRIQQIPFPRLSWHEAMERYGTDKPDLRFGLPLVEVTDRVRETEFRVFRGAVEGGGCVKGVRAPGMAGLSRKELDGWVQIAREAGAGGLAWLAFTADGVRSPIAKFLSEGEVQGIREALEAETGDLVFLAAGPREEVNPVLGRIRSELGARLNLLDPDVLAYAWVLDFPLFEWDEEEGRWTSAHHPFTMPHPDDLDRLEEDPGSVRSWAYDLVANGYELGSGSIRIHDPELQARIFRILGYTQEEIEARFGHLIRAFRYGAPPHGGIAPGLDRVVMLLAGETSIREVIAFPKTASAADLMMGAPSEVSPQQLEELHLRVVLPKEGAEG